MPLENLHQRLHGVRRIGVVDALLRGTRCDGRLGERTWPSGCPIDAARDEAQQVARGLRLGERGFTQHQTQITVNLGHQFDASEAVQTEVTFKRMVQAQRAPELGLGPQFVGQLAHRRQQAQGLRFEVRGRGHALGFHGG